LLGATAPPLVRITLNHAGQPIGLIRGRQLSASIASRGLNGPCGAPRTPNRPRISSASQAPLLRTRPRVMIPAIGQLSLLLGRQYRSESPHHDNRARRSRTASAVQSRILSAITCNLWIGGRNQPGPPALSASTSIAQFQASVNVRSAIWPKPAYALIDPTRTGHRILVIAGTYPSRTIHRVLVIAGTYPYKYRR